jgi:hypothetical protein
MWSASAMQETQTLFLRLERPRSKKVDESGPARRFPQSNRWPAAAARNNVSQPTFPL